jgi:hypothetical protein
MMNDDTTARSATAQLAHESLIRSWSRFATWVDADAAFQRWLVTMEDRVAENELLSEARIREAERWLVERSDDVPAEVRQLVGRSKAFLRARILRPLFAIGIAIVLFGVPVGGGVLKYMLSDEQTKLLRVAEVTAAAVSADILRGKMPTDLRDPNDGTHIAVYVDPGLRILGTGPEGGDPAVYAALHGEISNKDLNGELVVAVPVTHDTDVIGAARAASPRSTVYLQIIFVWLFMLALACLAIGTAWLVTRRRAVALYSYQNSFLGSVGKD